MGELVLGRLILAVESGRSTSLSPHAWVAEAQLDRALAGVSCEVAERAGRDLIDRDVRVGPYRFLRSELSLASLDVVGRAIFRSYFSDPHVEFRASRRSLDLHWMEPIPRSDQYWALVDGMAKRIAELARVGATDWSITRDGERRTLSGLLDLEG